MTTRRCTAWVVGGLLVTLAVLKSGTAAAAVLTMPCLNGGKEVFSYPGCWFGGEVGQSCAQVCANKGLVYDDNTRTVAGSDGTKLKCQDVLFAVLFHGGYPTVTDDNSCSDGYGCHIVTGSGGTTDVRCAPSPATTADAADPLIGRACACMPGEVRAPALSDTGLIVAGLLLLGGGVWLAQRRVTQ